MSNQSSIKILVALFQAWVVERMGKFLKVLDPGLNVLVPVLDRVKYVQSLKEIAIDIPQQAAITAGQWNPLHKWCSCCVFSYIYCILVLLIQRHYLSTGRCNLKSYVSVE